MVGKTLKTAVVAGALVVLTASTALAGSSSKVTGSGLTNDGNTLGFNAKEDLTGHYTYVAHSATFRVMCFSYDWYKLSSDVNGFPQVNVRATCVDQAGKTIYMETYYIDRGEPGVGGPREGDVARVYFTYNASWKSDPSDDPNRFWEDFSLIMKGNVQILPAQTSR